MSHTQGKVKVGLFGLETPDWDRRTIFDEQDNFFADTETSTKTYEEECANARRLVACWNALEGVPTEWLENYIAGGAKNLLQENAALKAESSQAQTIISELRVLIQNSLPADRNAPIWEMVKEFDRKYINKNSDSQNGAEE